MQSSAIRSVFIGYFRSQQHKLIPSAPIVPAQDQTLLFTNSGMVQFKDVFLGNQPRSVERAVTIQRCLRAGGKHNDLENVGYTSRHHTFFEMMGNFSFGDYFKEEAITYAWDFITKVLGLPEERLWITVHHSDQQAEDIWLKKIGVSEERFSRLDEDNFWSMGDTGPCGPCSEIFYDHGTEVAGGPPGSPDDDGDRYVEIWNLVFMQYQRDSSGEMTTLENPSIDTGMGLERIAAVLQNKVSNYDTDLFRPIIAKTADLLDCQNINNPSLKVISDHIRACSFLLFDGVTPSNEGRGYVLRRIIRRAVRHGYSIGSRSNFFSQLLPTLISTMDQYSTELKLQSNRISQVLDDEESQFRNTLEQGMNILDKYLETLSGKVISGDTIFRLYDTFGFPVDLTNDIARERGLSLDMQAFDESMKQQQDKSKRSHSFHATNIKVPKTDKSGIFVGYQDLSADTKVLSVVSDSQLVTSLNQGEQGLILLEKTPFYAESGGQVGDTGSITGALFKADVYDTIKHANNHWHLVKVISGKIEVDDDVHANVDEKRRKAIMRNHSATHLLHAALRRHLGDTVMQRGSLVSEEKLRFDFSHNQAVTRDQLAGIEAEVNSMILNNTVVKVQEMPMDEAKKANAIAFFEEKYGDQVRVLSMGELDDETYSVELCGGSHVSRTGDIGSFHIIHETGIASGVRRIEAVTAEGAQDWLAQLEESIAETASLLKTDRKNLLPAITKVIEKNKKLQKEMNDLQASVASGEANKQKEKPVTISGIQAIIRRIDNANPGALRSALDSYKNQLGQGAIFLAGENQGKVVMIAGVTNNLTDRVSAHRWIQPLAPLVGGKAGGRADMAQGGGSAVDKIDALIEEALTALKQQIEDKK